MKRGGRKKEIMKKQSGAGALFYVEVTLKDMV
jgi:hypothetical protein